MCVACSYPGRALTPVCCRCGLQDRRFSDEIDKLTGYKTKSLLCMPIRNSDGEIIGVAQAINKSCSGELFAEDDEKVITPTFFMAVHGSWLTFWHLISMGT